MKNYSIALATAMVLSVIVGGQLGFAQSSNQKELAQRHFEAAKKAAGYEVAELYDHLCSRLLVGASLPFGRIIPQDNDRDPAKFHAEPVKVFDNLYYVGEKMQHGASPSAWAVVTSDGIIMIDALFDNSVDDEIVGGLRKMKLDPEKIKYLIASHGHADHIAGAKY